MARVRTTHRCAGCGSLSPKWTGRCGDCGAWNTLVEKAEPAGAGCRGEVGLPPPGQPTRLSDVVDGHGTHRPTGVAELDRVLGGGLVDGSVTLVGGEPGIGKSTLMLQAAAAAAWRGRTALYVTGEESVAQIRSRAARLEALHNEVWLVAETVLANLVDHLDGIRPDLVVVDSIQTLHDHRSRQAPGSVTQIRDCAQVLVREAKQRDVPVLLVGHVTKDGALAGPRLLEHVVDTVVSFEGDRHHALRLLRVVKHRFGPTAEVGVLQMDDAGLAAVDDPSAMFLADRVPGVSGSAVVATVDGRRPVLLEVQALVAGGDLTNPRRNAQGIDPGRLAMVLAVLERRVGHRLSRAEVHALAVGGARIADPGADAGLALAVVSSLIGQPLPDDLVILGEVGLGGEMRHVTHGDRRLAEARRRGFKRAIVPFTTPDVDDIELLRAPTLSIAVGMAGL